MRQSKGRLRQGDIVNSSSPKKGTRCRVAIHREALCMDAKIAEQFNKAISVNGGGGFHTQDIIAILQVEICFVTGKVPMDLIEEHRCLIVAFNIRLKNLYHCFSFTVKPVLMLSSETETKFQTLT